MGIAVVGTGCGVRGILYQQSLSLAKAFFELRSGLASIPPAQADEATIIEHLSNNKNDWGRPVLDHVALQNTADWQSLDFPPQSARFLRLVTHREVLNRRFASLAELQIIPATP